MHNCNETRRVLVDLAMDEVRGFQNAPAANEFGHCEQCSSEFASVKRSLRLVEQSCRAGMPRQEFWAGYEERLRRRLEDEAGDETQDRPGRLHVQHLARVVFTSTVRVPLYAAIAVVGLFCISLAVAIHARTLASKRDPAPVTVVTKFVEVPLVQDRILTRVVYRDRPGRVVNSAANRDLREPVPRPTSAKTTVAHSLVGFRPAHDLNLVIIKGDGRDQK